MNNTLKIIFADESDYRDAIQEFKYQSDFNINILDDDEMSITLDVQNVRDAMYDVDGILNLIDISRYHFDDEDMSESKKVKVKTLIERRVERVIAKKLNENAKHIYGDLNPITPKDLIPGLTYRTKDADFIDYVGTVTDPASGDIRYKFKKGEYSGQELKDNISIYDNLLVKGQKYRLAKPTLLYYTIGLGETSKPATKLNVGDIVIYAGKRNHYGGDMSGNHFFEIPGTDKPGKLVNIHIMSHKTDVPVDYMVPITESKKVKVKTLIERIVERVIAKKLNESTGPVFGDMNPISDYDLKQPGKQFLEKSGKILTFTGRDADMNTGRLKYSFEFNGRGNYVYDWNRLIQNITLVNESIKPKRRLKEAYSEFINLQDFESHINDNIDDILYNMKTYGFTLDKIKNMRNYYDLSSLTDIDSNQLRNVELYTYANTAYDLIKQEMDDRAERF